MVSKIKLNVIAVTQTHTQHKHKHKHTNAHTHKHTHTHTLYTHKVAQRLRNTGREQPLSTQRRSLPGPGPPVYEHIYYYLFTCVLLYLPTRDDYAQDRAHLFINTYYNYKKLTRDDHSQRQDTCVVHILYLCVCVCVCVCVHRTMYPLLIVYMYPYISKNMFVYTHI
jgi:hypothetical protein